MLGGIGKKGVSKYQRRSSAASPQRGDYRDRANARSRMGGVGLGPVYCHSCVSNSAERVGWTRGDAVSGWVGWDWAQPPVHLVDGGAGGGQLPVHLVDGWGGTGHSIDILLQKLLRS